MFGIGMPELILILAIALIVIGPKKLPDLAKSLGRAMREFKKATSELKDSMELDQEIQDVKTAFDDVSGDVKGSFLDSNGANNGDAAEDTKVKDLKQSYDEWKREAKPAVPPENAEAPDDQPDTGPADENSEPDKHAEASDKEGSAGNA
jgi:TatA/E family protein of Tat protein translocase